MIVAARRAVLLVFAIGTAACDGSADTPAATDAGSEVVGDSGGVCPPLPDAATLSCEAGAAGVLYCQGLPRNPWCGTQGQRACEPSDLATDAGAYPLGCVISFAMENPFYQCGGPQTCECSTLYSADAGNPQWLCPL